ncbi:MAG: hypothetical protein MRJ96_08535 [Nitrospirales bacterium]|nr:hypothetical protein [Nitrospira sp.]MDR4501480.1 hypothetical protein [Nitrospirales bacterium]
MRHRLQIQSCHTQLGEEPFSETSAAQSLEHCMADHAIDLRVSEVDAKSGTVQFRCRVCRRAYHLAVSLFETHQR